MEQALVLYVNSDKTEFMYFKQDGAIAKLNAKILILEDHFLYLGSNISSNENDVNVRIGKE